MARDAPLLASRAATSTRSPLHLRPWFVGRGHRSLKVQIVVDGGARDVTPRPLPIEGAVCAR